MNSKWNIILIVVITFLSLSCSTKEKQESSMQYEMKTAKEILGNPNYPAISYGGYRGKTRDIQPTLEELKEDMRILHAMGIRIFRTYNTQKFPHSANVLKAISELRKEDPGFEMYVMLGVWIDCKNAWTEQPPDHYQESEGNVLEIEKAIELTNTYPEIVKVIAVGNEAMVTWAATYYVQPDVILKWVKHLQQLKGVGKLPKDLWITSSDNFASWGGGDTSYHVEALNQLIAEVDYISMHTYPMHDTHYNPEFWGVSREEESLSKEEKAERAMIRSVNYAKSQYEKVRAYVDSLGYDTPIHIGETGWASLDADNHHFGRRGSGATDEYKEALYYTMMREWTDSAGISCFYFEAFDEPWKDSHSSKGSENHFGLFTVEGKAKYVIWDLVDSGVFDRLTRNGNPILKTHDGDKDYIIETMALPPAKEELEAAF